MSPEASVQSTIGIVLAANGEVFLRSDSGMRPVEAGTPVYQGEELVTGAKSNAEVRFADDTLLSQGADSVISLDDYIYGGTDDSNSALLFKMTQGTFRMVTGKIAEQNPDRFQVGTPLATIGIRGTTTVHEIIPGGGEKHGVEEIHAGKALLVQSVDGSIRMIDSPQALVDIAMSGMMSTVRAMTVQELNSFREIAPSAIQQEQEIREREQDAQDEQQGAGEEKSEGEQQEGEQGEVEGGETEAMQIAGEGVLEAGVVEMLAGSVFEGEEGLKEAIEELAQEYAEQFFEGMVSGDLGAVQEYFGKLEKLPTEDDIIELVEGIAEGTTEVPEGLENVTYTTSEGINYILGDSVAGDNWEGTPNTDYYDGQGGNDTISGLEGGDGLRGGTGDDTIFGNCGNDSIEGGDGNDIIYGGGDNDELNGSAGDDTIYGDEGSDFIDGNADNDIVYGGDGSDTVDGGAGNDTLFGGAGEDIIIGNTGYDFVSYADQTPSGSDGVFVDLNTSYDGAGIGSLDSVVDKIETVEGVIGTIKNDTLKGDGLGNTLQGGLGNDSLNGGAGGDTYYYTGTAEGGDSIDGFSISEGDFFRFDGTDFSAGTATNFKSINYTYDGGNATLGNTEPAFVYDSTGNVLWYDSNGDDAGGNTEIASLVNSDDITEAQINVV